MRWIDVKWLHDLEEEPIRLVSELDLDGYETRKLEFFRNGRVGFASAAGASPGTELGTVSVQAIDRLAPYANLMGWKLAGWILKLYGAPK
ncbi:MAG: hypothetical protein V4631_22255 [Pseudomonadota bacterium]